MKYISIVGATGNVGRELITVLEQRNIDVSKLLLLCLKTINICIL